MHKKSIYKKNLFSFKSIESVIESKILSQGGERRFWFGSRREWISCRTSSQHAWMGCQQWSGQVQLFSASVSSSARRWTSIIAKIIMMSTTLTGVHGVVTATLKQQSSGQWKTNHSSGSLLLLPIVILFLISCWINSAPLHDEFSFRVTKAHTVEDGQLLEKLFIWKNFLWNSTEH